MWKIDLRDIPQNIIDNVDIVYGVAPGTVTISKLKNKVILTLPMIDHGKNYDDDTYGYFYHLASVIYLSSSFKVGEEVIATKYLEDYDIIAIKSCLRMGYKAKDLLGNLMLSRKTNQDEIKQLLTTFNN